MTKKETKKTEEKVDEKDARIAELEQMLMQSNTNIQTLVNTANNYIALCQHYEQTINILTGRIQEMQTVPEQNVNE